MKIRYDSLAVFWCSEPPPASGGAIVFLPATQSDIDRYDRAVESAIATCGGDLRGALKALIIANEYLEEELRQVLDAVAAHDLTAVLQRDVA